MTDAVRIPEKVFREFDLPEENYALVTNGYNSSTWISETYVVQAVHSQSLEHHDAVLQITQSLRDLGQGIFPGLDFQKHPVIAESAWWRISRRIEGPIANTLDQHRLKTYEENYKSLLDDLTLLAGVEAPVSLPECTLSQNISAEEILGWLEDIEEKEVTETLNSLPAEPDSKIVVAHGDPLLKNIILSKKGVVLVDWESCQILPQLYDPGHNIANLLTGSKWGPPSSEEALEAHRLLQLSASYLGYELDDREITSLLAYALFREAMLNQDDPHKLPKAKLALEYIK